MHDIRKLTQTHDFVLQVDFDTFFHEHKNTKTVLGFRKCLRACYEFIRIGIYHCFLVCCGIPNVLIWACVNGYMVYLITWVYQPWLRLTAMCWYSCAPLLFLPFNAIILPVIKAVARAICQLRIKATLDGPLTEGVAAAVRSTSQSHAA